MMQLKHYWIVWLMGIFLPVYTAEVILDGRILIGKEVPLEEKPDNFKPYDQNIAYYGYADNVVAVGYNDKAIAKLAMDIVYSREDQINVLASKLPVSSKKIVHIKIIADVAAAQDALKLFEQGMVVGDSFDIVDNKGTVIKSKCYLLVAKKEGVMPADITNATDALYAAIAGTGL